MTCLLLWILAASPAAESLPFNSLTYSADEDARWVVSSAIGLPGNAHYIGGPGEKETRGDWLEALHRYRREIREHLRDGGQVEITFRGVRAWVRMQGALARAIDLRPGESFHIDVEARWLEGNGELVLALDLLDRETGAWRGWSTVFSTLEVPRDGKWHRLTWEGKLPSFNHAATRAKVIFGMDGTHNRTAGTVVVRNFSLRPPERARKAISALQGIRPASGALNRHIYDRPDLRWAARIFTCHFTFLYDLSIYDHREGRYTLSKFLEEGEREFGGYDALVLWHAYPRIGVDERNQFDFYRDMPGGLEGLRDLSGQLHRRGIRVFINYNPWDRGTRREGVSDEEAIASIVKAIQADGVFLDTMSAGRLELREAVDRARPGVVFEPEGRPPVEQLEFCSASWAQWFQELERPGLLRLKWIEPRHLQHQIKRWEGSHGGELESALFNGSGMLVWENIFGTWNPWPARDRSALRHTVPVLRRFADNFISDAWDPLVETLVPGVYANRWPGKDGTVWTILNFTGKSIHQPVLRVASPAGARFYDLWNLTRLDPVLEGGQAEIRLSPGGRIGCVARLADDRLEGWISRQRELRGKRAASLPDSARAGKSIVDPEPVQPTPGAPRSKPPAGMVLVPAGTVTMNLRHMRRECGCYPDPGTPRREWRKFLWGNPHGETLEHHIGPLSLPPYFIDACEVTNAEYARFLKESGYRPVEQRNFLKHWKNGSPPENLLDHPVVYVSLEDARAYARWAGKRLPTEPEWHRAAQGDDGRTWPWGNEFDPERVNGNGKGTTPVKAYPGGRSPFGCQDMSGNVWEWTESERSDGHTRFSIIRGGSYFRAEGSIWYVPGGPRPITSHAKFIHLYPGLDRCSTIGFRCVKDVAP